LILGFLLVVWGRQLQTNFCTLRRTRSGQAFMGLLMVLPLLGMVWVGQRVVVAMRMTTALAPVGSATPLPQHYPRLQRPAPAFRLIDQHGRTASLAAHHGDVIMLTFAFAHCQTICSTVVQTARAALEATPGAALWIVTLDPWRDTPGALPGLASRWRLDGDKVRLLSGEVDTVLATLDAYNIPHQRDTRTGDITHPALVYIIDTTGRIAYAFTNPSRAWLVEAMSRLARSDLS
jgi:cytochrome oxidase Cu insertion factor (SCO1/SenC/PrrC family)